MCGHTRERLILREEPTRLRMMYASCRATRTEVIDKDKLSSHSRDHPRPGLRYSASDPPPLDVRVRDCGSDSFSMNRD